MSTVEMQVHVCDQEGCSTSELDEQMYQCDICGADFCVTHRGHIPAKYHLLHIRSCRKCKLTLAQAIGQFRGKILDKARMGVSTALEASDLVKGKTYYLKKSEDGHKAGEPMVFVGMMESGKYAIVHHPNEPDTQSHFGVVPEYLSCLKEDQKQ